MVLFGEKPMFDQRDDSGFGLASGSGSHDQGVVAVEDGRDHLALSRREVAKTGKEDRPGVGEAGFEVGDWVHKQVKGRQDKGMRGGNSSCHLVILFIFYLFISWVSWQNTNHAFRLNLENRLRTAFLFHRAKNGGNPLTFGLGQLQFAK